MVSTPAQIRQIVRAFVRTLEPDIHVQRVVLYGSYANGGAHKWSDIDIAVLSDDFEHMTEIEKTQFLARRTIHCDSRLVPMGYTPAQFDNAQPYQFAAEIKRTGKVMYEASRGRRRSVKRTPEASLTPPASPAPASTPRRVARRPAARPPGRV